MHKIAIEKGATIPSLSTNTANGLAGISITRATLLDLAHLAIDKAFVYAQYVQLQDNATVGQILHYYSIKDRADRLMSLVRTGDERVTVDYADYMALTANGLAED